MVGEIVTAATWGCHRGEAQRFAEKASNCSAGNFVRALRGGRGFTVVGPKATHLPHEDPKKRNRLFQRVLSEPLTPWFSPLVWAMRMAGSKLEETLGLL